MSLSHSPRVVTNGLILYLDAANTKSCAGSGTTWLDLSGNARTGTLTNGPTYSSSNKGAITFDGTNDYVSMSLPTLTDLTISLWIKIVSLPGGEKQAFSSPGDSVGMSVLNNKFFTWIGAGVTGSQTVSTDRWYNWIVTRSGSTTRIVIDTVVDGSAVAGRDLTGGTCYLSSKDGFDRFLNSTISSASVYNRVLTDAEIVQNFNALRGRFSL